MRVALADDAVLLRQGLRSLLETEGIEVCCEAGDAAELLRAVRSDPPDAVVTDIRMPPAFSDEGIGVAEKLAETNPDVGVLVLSQYLEPAFAMRVLDQAVPGRGYLLKERVPNLETFISALKAIASGGSYLDPAVVQQLMGKSQAQASLRDLTERELDILKLMAEGRSNGGISDRLYLSPKTVEGYVRSIFMKLNLPQAADDHRRVLAVVRYLKAQ